MILFVLLVALCGCASTTLGKSLNVGVAGSAVADYVTTRQGIARGGQEANPVGDSAIRQALLKIGGVGFVWGFSGWVEIKGKPVIAHVIRSMAIVGWSVVSVRNDQIGR